LKQAIGTVKKKGRAADAARPMRKGDQNLTVIRAQ
jgi:hypothetical protein